ncbi:MAG: NERD domain-containing protein [Anaerolineales bacterium]|nr:NERD domain-containing protein [Anaerolineales bacterium]
MRLITNEALYKRNSRVALVANLAGMFMLVISLYLLFSSTVGFGLYLLFLTGGMIFTQVGTYFNRWNKRPDHKLHQALKSLDDNYSLYNYTSPVSHLLVGPTGLWILLPRHTTGSITYDAKRRRWKASGVPLLKRLGQEGIGNPISEATVEAEILDRWLSKHLKDQSVPVSAALIFLEPGADVQVGTAALPTVPIKKLKQLVIKPPQGGGIGVQRAKQLSYLFENAKQKAR